MPAIIGANNYSIMDDLSSFFSNVTIKGGGTLDVGRFPYAGANTGFIAGGSGPGGTFSGLQRFPFATDTIASEGSIPALGRTFSAGHSSSTTGYVSMGTGIGSIHSYPFAAGTAGTVSSNISNPFNSTPILVQVQGAGGVSSEINGYLVGGSNSSNVILQRILRFTFYGDTTQAATIGSLGTAQAFYGGMSSTSHGYTAGGRSPAVTSTIQKFAFVPEGDSTTVGNLSIARSDVANASSPTSGYTAGGLEPSYSNSVDKFPFASDASATLLGNLGAGKRANITGLSSVSKGYFAGGIDSGGTRSTSLEAFSYPNDTSYSTVGTLSTAVSAASAQQF